MSYTKVAKPKNSDFLLREDASYLLLEHGGRIIISGGWNKGNKPAGSYSIVAKPSGSYTKVAKPAI